MRVINGKSMVLGWLLGAGLLLSTTVSAATFDILVDQDSDSTTGCTVATPDGPFSGVEFIVTTTVNTGVSPAMVTGVTRRDCTTPPTFGPPIAVDPGGWPVGVGNGTGGYDVLETYFPLLSPTRQLRLGFVYTAPNIGSDAVLGTNGLAGGPGIVLIPAFQAIPAIPTLAHGTLLLLAFALGWFALRRLRQHKVSTLVIAGVLTTVVAGTAWAAFVMDGLITDWTGIAPIATDPLGDAPGGADIAAIFAKAEDLKIFVRADIKITVPPVVDLNGAQPGIDFGPVTFSEPGPAVAVVGTVNPNALTITDGDSANIGSATITLTNVQDTGAETLALTCPAACSGLIQPGDIVPTSTATTYTLTITRTAPKADYAALLRTLTYNNGSLKPTPGTNRLITFRISDLVNDNTPLAQATVHVVGVNNAPTITAPSNVTTPKNTAFAFAAGNTVSIADVDAGSDSVKLTLTATNGTVVMTGFAASSVFVRTAAASDHNTALATLQFTPNSGYAGPASVKIDVDDLGNTGTGGPLAATKTISITVDPPPTVLSSDPAHNDDNVPTNKIITFTFSEPVTVNANSFSLECPVGIGLAFNRAPVGPASIYTLTPIPSLPPGVICTVAAFNNHITDSVGQQLAASHVASFRVSAMPSP